MPLVDPVARNKYARQWIAKRRADFFADKSCVICGSTDRMELDHINPNNKIDHRIWSWSKERQAVEIAKCQVLCFDCHKAKSIEQLPMTQGHTPYQHGTRSMYNTHHCRCEACKLWNSNRSKKLRASKK